MKTATEIDEFESLKAEIKRGSRVISLSGLTSVSSKAFVLSELQKQTEQNFVIVTGSNKEAETFEGDLAFFQSNIFERQSAILTLPSFDSDIYANLSPHAETLEKRALTLWNLTHKQPEFLILSAKSLITKTLTPEEVRKLGLNLKCNDEISPGKLLEMLISTGYLCEDPVKNVGEFSLRGGIVDLWSPMSERPFRIEFFGDTIDSVREFDAETQLSTGQIKEVSIAPMREFAARKQDLKDWSFFAREKFADEKFARAIADRAQFADEGETFSGWEFLFPLVQPRLSDVFGFLKTAVFVIDEPVIIEKTLVDFYESQQKRFEEITDVGEIGIPPQDFFLTAEDLRKKFENFQRIELRALGKTVAQTDEDFLYVG
jgi:transcription-repair coupling factor (superfamily II helicase)